MAYDSTCLEGRYDERMWRKGRTRSQGVDVYFTIYNDLYCTLHYIKHSMSSGSSDVSESCSTVFSALQVFHGGAGQVPF